jgi:hypothetical protein
MQPHFLRTIEQLLAAIGNHLQGRKLECSGFCQEARASGYSSGKSAVHPGSIPRLPLHSVIEEWHGPGRLGSVNQVFANAASRTDSAREPAEPHAQLYAW